MTTRSKAITAYCRDCIADDAASGTWREQVGACTSIACQLWKYRPLPSHAPAWLASRKVADLPADWASLGQEAAIGRLRKNIDGNASGSLVQANGEQHGTEALHPMRLGREARE